MTKLMIPSCFSSLSVGMKTGKVKKYVLWNNKFPDSYKDTMLHKVPFVFSARYLFTLEKYFSLPAHRH